jgi:ubiquinone/menaquinone biosynthesis C-methylase UbiE
MVFNRQFWFGLVAGLALGAVVRQRRKTGVTQERLDAYYHRRAKNYNLTDYLFLGQFPRITMRKTLIEMMNLKPGDTVLDFACGAGANFPYIMEKIGPTGKLIGVDYSQDMLDAAREQIVLPNGWQNVELIQSDAAEMRFDQQFDVVMVTLGLAVIPRWETAMERGWEMVKPGGVFGVADLAESERWYTQPIRFLTDLIDVAIIADSSRRPWEWMQTRGTNYQRKEIFHGYFYAATIRKPKQ